MSGKSETRFEKEARLEATSIANTAATKVANAASTAILAQELFEDEFERVYEEAYREILQGKQDEEFFSTRDQDYGDPLFDADPQREHEELYFDDLAAEEETLRGTAIQS